MEIDEHAPIERPDHEEAVDQRGLHDLIGDDCRTNVDPEPEDLATLEEVDDHSWGSGGRRTLRCLEIELESLTPPIGLPGNETEAVGVGRRLI
jgi:hypothetical protein